MIRPTPTTLHGQHVTLVPMAREHVGPLFDAGQYDEVWQWLPWPRPQSLADMERQVAHALADADRVPFVVVHDDRVVGTTSYLDIDELVSGLEIGGTWYTPAVWAGPVNPECKLLLLSHAFDDLGAQRVLFKTDALNARSRAAIGKLGALYDGTLRHHRLRSDGSVRDSAYFSVLAAEWPAVREGLRARVGSAGSPRPRE
jgi:RimJ/RimL family protein N-acetyltransferase